MGTGRFRITYALLKELLHLPDDAEIVAVNKDWQGQGHSVEVYIEHKDLPIVPVGHVIPKGEIVLKRNPPVEFVGWGIYE